jgi:3-hydroxyisobutyrate dehydrogenase
MRVGLIGTGHMGNPIARHLLRAGHSLSVSDLRREAAADLIELGATWADNAAGVAAASDVVFTSLPGPADVDEAVLGEGGVLEAAHPGLIHVDLSTNLPSAVRRLAALEQVRGVSFLEAPLSGLVAGAEAGTLTVFAGGDYGAFEAVKPLLDAFCANVFHVGGAGLGNIMKLTNNIMVHASALVVQEALALAVKAGIDPMAAYRMWDVSSSSRFVQEIPSILRRDFDNPTFTLALAAKDIGLCLEAARELAVPMSVGAAAAQVYTRALARGYGGVQRVGGTLLTIEEEAGIRIGGSV